MAVRRGEPIKSVKFCGTKACQEKQWRAACALNYDFVRACIWFCLNMARVMLIEYKWQLNQCVGLVGVFIKASKLFS